MSKDEIKYQINKVLDSLPDKTLEDLLNYLKTVEKNGSKSLLDKDTLERILNEDNDLLEKLAK